MRRRTKTNDLLAIGVLQALALMGGLAVPDDMALVGYDDIDFARSAVVPLTSVRQPRQAIGVTAIELLLAAAKDGSDHQPEHVVFQPELVSRESTGAEH